MNDALPEPDRHPEEDPGLLGFPSAWFEPGTRRRFFSSRESCSYLPDQCSRMEYEFAPTITAEEYSQRLLTGWRRFGTSLFRPRCPHCDACRSLRVDVARFRPSRSQRRACQKNDRQVELRIGAPGLSREKLALYHGYHAYQTATKAWPSHDDVDPTSYFGSFVLNPFATQEWCYYLDGRLIGVGYVDTLRIGLSAIYFFHGPEHRDRSLGTWNVLRLIDHCRDRGLPHVYLGYHVADCGSLAYKARFAPNEILRADGTWVEFQR